MTRHLFVSAIVASTVLMMPALASDPPQLPASARKLNGEEIRSLYDGATIKYENYTQAMPMTGTVTFDLKKGTELGTFSIGSDKGSFSGSVRVNGDQWCHKDAGPEDCVSVFTDGNYIYEVNEKGIVESKNQKQ